MPGTAAEGYQFKDTAVITIRGADLEESPVPRAAWEVYQSIRTRAQREEADGYKLEGAPGYRWRGDIHTIFYDLWPAGQEIIEGKPHAATRTAIVQWLLRTRNIVNLERGQPASSARSVTRLSLWWIPAEFSGDIPGEEEQDSPDAAGKEEEEGEEKSESQAEPDGESRNKCAEPGCPASFKSSPSRAHHESSAHPNSPYRVFECLTGFCQDSKFYRLAGALHHIATVHDVKAGTSAYTVLKSQMEHEAAAKLASLEKEREGKKQVLPDPDPVQPAIPAPVFIPPGPPPRKDKPLLIPAADGGTAASDQNSTMFREALVVLGNIHKEYDKVISERNALQEKVSKLQAENEQLRSQQPDEKLLAAMDMMRAALGNG